VHQPAFHLSHAQRGFFKREGYLVIDKLMTAEDVAMLRNSYDRIFARAR
jgi:hypothetical protein